MPDILHLNDVLNLLRANHAARPSATSVLTHKPIMPHPENRYVRSGHNDAFLKGTHNLGYYPQPGIPFGNLHQRLSSIYRHGLVK